MWVEKRGSICLREKFGWGFSSSQSCDCRFALVGILPLAEKRAGMAEVLKYGMIADSKLFGSLAKGPPRSMRKVVKRCVEIKAKLAGEDEMDLKGKRALLNFGHTVAHGLRSRGV